MIIHLINSNKSFQGFQLLKDLENHLQVDLL